MNSHQLLPQIINDKYAGKIPVPVVAIAKDLGLEIYETKDFDDSQSGSIVRENSSYVIYINPSHTPERKRFTIAHEIGHFLLHKDKLGSELVDSVKNIEAGVPMLNRTETNGVAYHEETEANNFAADLLMPEKEFVKVWNEAKTVQEVAEKFQVSKSAASVRARILFNNSQMKKDGYTQ